LSPFVVDQAAISFPVYQFPFHIRKMRTSIALTAALLGTATALPTTTTFTQLQPRQNSNFTNPPPSAPTSNEPCAVAAFQAETSENGFIDADVAYQCLQSVPLDAEGAALQVQGLLAYSEFQSTLAYLKDPPEGYLYPAVDIVSGLERIGERVAAGRYSGEVGDAGFG
jgi:hypothetical protein